MDLQTHEKNVWKIIHALNSLKHEVKADFHSGFFHAPEKEVDTTELQEKTKSTLDEVLSILSDY